MAGGTERKYMKKRSYDMSEAAELLATERKILQYVQKGSKDIMEDTVKPITKISLFDFRKRIQKKKDKMEADMGIEFEKL